MVGERGPQHPRIAHQRAAGLERRVQPLVRIDGDRVGLGETAQQSPAPRARRRRSRRTRRRRGTRRRAPGTPPRCPASGSTAPVLTEPAVPTTMNGTSPAAMSASIVRRSAATSIRRSSPVGIQRIDAVPRPDRSAAFWIHVCVSSEPYTRRRRPSPPAMPCVAHVPAGLRGARRQEADDVRHVAAADEQPAALGGVADQLGDPAHRLTLDLGRGRRRASTRRRSG